MDRETLQDTHTRAINKRPWEVISYVCKIILVSKKKPRSEPQSKKKNLSEEVELLWNVLSLKRPSFVRYFMLILGMFYA